MTYLQFELWVMSLMTRFTHDFIRLYKSLYKSTQFSTVYEVVTHWDLAGLAASVGSHYPIPEADPDY